MLIGASDVFLVVSFIDGSQDHFVFAKVKYLRFFVILIVKFDINFFFEKEEFFFLRLFNNSSSLVKIGKGMLKEVNTG